MKVLIIGGGFAGCSAAHMLSSLPNTEVDIIERNTFLGAGNKTRWYGGHPYTFGPRHFLTPYDDVFSYLNQILPINLCPEHEFLSYVEADNQFYAYPINMQDVRSMPDSKVILDELDDCKKQIELNGSIQASNLEEYWLNSVGRSLYEKLIKPYNSKMWLVDDVSSIDTFKWSPKGAAIKDGPRAAWTEVYSGYPFSATGYDDYFQIATEDSNVYLSTTIDSIDLLKKSVVIAGNSKSYDVIVNTIGLDSLLPGVGLPKLPYLGRKLELIVFPTQHVFPENVYFLYYPGAESFTRLVEYKKFTKHVSPTSLVGMEIPVNNGGQDYPMPFKWAQKLASEYHNLFGPSTFSMGRAGSYLYGIDIDDCIKQSFILKEHVVSGSWDHPVPGNQYRFPELNN